MWMYYWFGTSHPGNFDNPLLTQLLLDMWSFKNCLLWTWQFVRVYGYKRWLMPSHPHSLEWERIGIHKVWWWSLSQNLIWVGISALCHSPLSARTQGKAADVLQNIGQFTPNSWELQVDTGYPSSPICFITIWGFTKAFRTAFFFSRNKDMNLPPGKFCKFQYWQVVPEASVMLTGFFLELFEENLDSCFKVNLK